MLEKLEPILKHLPEIKAPTRVPSLQERLFWTISVLIMFFVMYETTVIGLHSSRNPADFISIVTAGRSGSLVTVGIGPIVIASILLQLLKGAKILKIDLQDTKQRALFLQTQKLLAIILAFIEAYVFIAAGRVMFIDPNPSTGLFMFVIFQIAMGSIFLLYMDEIVSRYGIGSGISLFIAAGVSIAIVGSTLDTFVGQNGIISMFEEPTAQTVALIIQKLIPVLITLAIILVNVYVDGLKIEIPIALGNYKIGAKGFPIKFLYVSNLPVILASAFIIHFQLLAFNIAQHDLFIGNINIAPFLAYSEGKNPMVSGISDGLLYFILPPPHYQLLKIPIITFYQQYLFARTPITNMPGIVHIVTYVIVFTLLCIISGFLWVETSGMGARDLAEQLLEVGYTVRGYRADPRIMESFLNRYIPAITLLGSAFVGMLAAFADLLGAFGTGTGILLTVSIFARLHEQFKMYQLYDVYPVLNKLFKD
ncbi:MAG: preprotein translocase subunit SecY [Candidatus Micrarchaeota archaeon]|nr:preprotein translocase subunit SecY [Candidatus Micrarchaeota archaeon]